MVCITVITKANKVEVDDIVVGKRRANIVSSKPVFPHPRHSSDTYYVYICGLENCVFPISLHSLDSHVPGLSSDVFPSLL